jgi:steroid delta-isomerase-like uncharacterized protein
MKRKSAVYWLGLTLLMSFGDALWVVGAQSQEPVGNVNVEQNKALVRRWIEEGFNKKNLKVVDEIFVEDFVVSGQRIGRAGLKRSMTRFFTAFPDLHVTITDLLAEGDKVVLWYTVRGTHKGEFEGFRPSGKLVNWSGSDLLRIAAGKIVEGRFLDDLLGLPRKIGN